MRKALLFAALIPVVFAIVFAGCAQKAPAPAEQSTERTSQQGSQQSPGQPGATATNLTGTTLQGGKIALADYRGKTVLLNFFGPG